MGTGEPSTRMRVFFWFILGSLSLLFAEVVSGSQIYAFFTLANWLMVFPLYTLHTLALWTLVFRYGRGRFRALFPAGAIFGLYEAYIARAQVLRIRGVLRPRNPFFSEEAGCY